MPVVFNMTSGSGTPQTIRQVFKNDPVKGKIRLIKRDRDYAKAEPDESDSQNMEATGDAADQPPLAQGDSVLSGAVYGLYAREDILSQDQSGQILYHAGEQVVTGTTDEMGEIIWEDLTLVFC